jgi:hypothetical protein
MSLIADIADAVTTELNSGSFGQPFTAERHYLARFELKQLGTLRVPVVPKAATIETAARGQTQHDVQIDVGVLKKLGAADNAEIDPLVTLVEELADHFRLQRLASYPNAIWTKTENDPIYSHEHLERMRQFTSVLTLTFRVIR